MGGKCNAQRDAFENWISGKPWFSKAKMRLDKSIIGEYVDILGLF